MKPAAHLTCVGAQRHEIRHKRLGGRGRHVVALRGDPPTVSHAPYEAVPDG